jgi:ribosomal-protein-alanine N-acetyltransferase
MPPVNPESNIRADPLLLEPILPLHAERLFDCLQAPELYTFIPHDAPESLQVLTARYMRWSARQSADGSEMWLNYAIYHPQLHKYVGTVQATVLRSGETHLAYEVFPMYWRRRYARTACVALIRHVFACYEQVGTVSALLDTRNEASWRLLESIGFRRTNTIVAADWFKGASSDEYVYEMARLEFAAAHSDLAGGPAP